MAENNPCSGFTPDAIPKAIARGSATIPIITPEIKYSTFYEIEYLVLLNHIQCLLRVSKQLLALNNPVY